MKIDIPAMRASAARVWPPPWLRRGYGRTWVMGLIPVVVFAVVICVVNAQASVERVDDGIQFTYYDPDAGQVFLAGTFNGWNATAHPMVRDDNGYWTVVMALGPGEHMYKFVVDGGWITDTDNPVTKADGYGGNNSLVVVDSKGEIVAQAASNPIANTLLSSKVFIGGRYLSRTNVERDVADDPRWRMQRPEENVDFNFNVTISEMVKGYTRMRVDTGEKVLQPNNIDVSVDEAHIEITPDIFKISGYYNEEILQSQDPLAFAGDADLPGTIFDDHLKEGKGTSGIVLSSNRYGFDFHGFLTNVFDFDIDNDPNLFDNTGTDLGHARVARTYRNITAGANFFATRNLWWLDFSSLVGTSPANTGIDRLDDYLDASGDPSDWFEFEDKSYNYGLDVTVNLYDGKLVPQIEYLQGIVQQGFVTSNKSGLEFDNGSVDVPILDRDSRIYHGSVKSTLIDRLLVNAEHTRSETVHPNPNENVLLPAFKEDVEANKQLFFLVGLDPATTTFDYSELELRWTANRYSAVLWLQRNLNEWNFPKSGDNTWLYNLSVSPGLTVRATSKLDLELEQQYTQFDGTNPALEGTAIETILRGAYAITNTVSAIGDVRYFRVKDDDLDQTDSYTAPYVGIQYVPTRKVNVVLAYGVDPLDFGIDYRGRHIGRYLFRQQYLFANPDATWRDAEQALADKKIVSLRAVYNF